MVHIGIVFMFIGFTGSAFNQDATLEVDTGSVSKIGHYDLRVADLQQGENENYAWHKAVIQVSRNGQAVATLEPERPAVQGKQTAYFRSLDPSPPERGPVPELRGHVERQLEGRHPGFRVSAGLVDLARLLGALFRNDRLPGSAEGETGLRPHRSGRRSEETCAGGKVVSS